RGPPRSGEGRPHLLLLPLPVSGRGPGGQVRSAGLIPNSSDPLSFSLSTLRGRAGVGGMKRLRHCACFCPPTLTLPRKGGGKKRTSPGEGGGNESTATRYQRSGSSAAASWRVLGIGSACRAG